MEEILFSEEFLSKLENLSLVAKKMHRGSSQGLKQTYRKGSSLEYQDHRSYYPGDDLRSVDWSVWARLGRLFVKLYTAEEDRTIYLLIDSSASMGSGSPVKLSYAVQAAAALAYIAASGQDRVGIVSFGEGILREKRPAKGLSEILSLFRFLASLEAGGRTNLNTVLKQFTHNPRRSGMVILITDLMDPSGHEEGLLSLLYNRFEVFLLHVLSEEEISPQPRGPVKLIDSETGDARMVTVDQDLEKAYRSALGEYLQGIEDFCLSRKMEYLRASSSVPLEDLILKYLRQGIYVR